METTHTLESRQQCAPTQKVACTSFKCFDDFSTVTVNTILEWVTFKRKKKTFEEIYQGNYIHVRGLANEVRDLLGELVGAADHHAVQSSRMLGDVNHDGSHFEDSSIVGLQPALGTVQCLRLGNVTFDHRSETESEVEISSRSDI